MNRQPERTSPPLTTMIAAGIAARMLRSPAWARTAAVLAVLLLVAVAEGTSSQN